ncbi:hypothetical protein MSIBF_A1410012 [groundwater metagenome]|uniref:Uncharacterized protein n=1 Tax=groundwater metagenome TaxID=717931 RepID=A0A098E7A1_9ZZZZ
MAPILVVWLFEMIELCVEVLELYCATAEIAITVS